MFALIMAGGVGKRFWPYSRSSLPKQFLKIIGKETMLEQTAMRLKGLVSPEDRIIVINKEHSELAANSPLLEGSLILKEPAGRNTAPCIGLAAIHLSLKAPDTPVAVIPADHHIPDTAAFQQSLKEAFELAKEGFIVTIGIVPTRPETGYGYIWRGEAIKSGDSAYRVKRFVEKPDLNKALEYMNSGEYFWNGGIFVFTPRIILEEIAIHLPDMYNKLQLIKEAVGSSSYNSVLKEAYEGLESISIDYGIMEKTTRPVVVVPARYVWSDVGSWQSLFELNSFSADSGENLLEGPAIAIDTKESFISNKTDKLVTVLGMEKVLVVNTDDVTLVMKLEESQRVQEIIETLKKKNWKEYL